MARPMYENKKHLQNERRIADELESDWKCILKKVSYKLSVDFAVCVDSIIKGWVEIKKRSINYNHSPLYMISMHKIKSARELAKETNLPFFLVIEFKDVIYYYKDNGENHILKWGGRIVTQRDDQDQEPCYYIDINLFKKLRKNT